MAGPSLIDRAAPPGPTAGTDLDTTACDREAIHVPGSIQPHGLMLIADLATQEVIGGAGEIEERLTPMWRGRPLASLLAQQIGATLLHAQAVPGCTVALAAVPGRREAFDGSLHLRGDLVIVELEPRAETASTAAAILSRLDEIGTGFERAAALDELCDRAAAGFRELTGFDRVMIYRFLDDSSGMVVAESRDPALPTFLNHHFPASDIPRQARELYIRNRVRVIPNAGYTPLAIRGDDRRLVALDLGDSALRSVSPIHLRYLSNMGVTASASVSIVKDGLLWGLVACHHRAPRRLGYDTRLACRALAGDLARQIRAKEEAETYRERLRLRQAEDSIVACFDQEAPFDRFFDDMADDMRRMLGADGFAAVQRGGITTVGVTPSPDQIRAIAGWIGGRANIEPFATATLAQRFPPAADHFETASGVLAVCLTTEVSTLLLWFRVEEPETVEWAGNPHKDVSADPEQQLTPRSSFEAWREIVRGRARRWTAGEVDAANRLRRALFQVRQSRRLRELNRELGATVADKEALLAEKDHLLREVNHRVQNSLQLVQAFLGLQARAEDNSELAAHLGEAQRRLSAVALVHRRLYQADQVDSVELGRYLEELIGDMRAAMGAEWQQAITLELAPIPVSASRAVTIGLIVTELVINANKYAYGGRAGPVAITLEEYRQTLRLIVADRGSGPTREREGFGTRMIQAMVQRLGGSIERRDNGPGLRVILTAPVED